MTDASTGGNAEASSAASTAVLDEGDAEVPAAEPTRAHPWRDKFRHILHRYPATIFLVLAITVFSAVTGAMWNDSVADPSLYDRYAYGLPALQDGRIWSFVVGAFLTPRFAFYLPILVLLVLAAGAYERRAGHLRTLAVVVLGQSLAALATALFLSLFEDSGWSWAVDLGKTLDLGISAGGFAALGALTAYMQPVWRTRTRVGASAYLIAMVLNSGLIWDVEHLLGWTFGALAGPFLAGRMPHRPSFDFGRRTQRAIVALVVFILAVSSLVDSLFPGNGGPFWSGGEAQYQGTALSFGVLLASLFWLVIADGLRRGHRVAWIFTTVLTVLGLLSLIGAKDSAETRADLALLGAQLLLLLVTARAFTARSPEGTGRRIGRRLLKVFLVLFAYTTVGFVLLQDEFSPPADVGSVIGEFFARIFFQTSDAIEPTTQAARWFVGSIGLIWLITIVISIFGLIYASRRTPPPPDQDERLHALLRNSPEASSIEWMLTWDGNTVWISSSGTTAIGYRVVGAVALGLGDPVGPLEERAEAMREFDHYCFVRGWIPCLFAAGQHTADHAEAIGWKAIQVAEDSVVPLRDLEFKGKAWQDVRTALNKAGKQDIRLEVTSWAESRPVVTDQLYAISQGWVSDKSLPEMGFTLGTLAEADDPEVRIHLALDPDQTVEGFTSWMPVARDGQVVGWTVDLMRRRDGGFRSVMEYLIGASALQLKEEGYEFISLSAAPLAKAPDQLSANSDQRVLQKLLDFLGDALEPYYGFRSLLAFKAKFQPEFRPMYLIFPDETALAEIGLAIARAYMPDATVMDWVRMSADMVLPGRGTHTPD
jgi:lysylphosphatidylglycerol synthetase-like protein (DUF2156 family)